VSGWWRQDTPIGPVTIVAGPRGIAAISWGGDDDELDFTARAVDAPTRRDRAVATAIDEWFAGDRKELDLDVDPSFLPSAPFARRVLDTLRSEVGWGEVVSYGELAEMAGGPGAARAVGTAMAHNPVPFVIPCHRVIAARGKLGGYGGTKQGATRNLAIKRWLLAHEGVLLFDS
jgi:methylated-DNA-[protein]-cysteine S-methyltransferase